MGTIRLPLPVGLKIESILSKGISKQSLSRSLMQNNMTHITSLGADENDAAYLFQYASEHKSDCITAVEQGYEFKFLTIRGLKNFLQLRYGLIDGVDLIFKEDSLESVKLRKAWLRDIETAITKHWSFTIVDEYGSSVMGRFTLAQRELQVGTNKE
ncbi:hypothetical protein [Peribacillus deserti]|uniref:Uncharacterized protein n=1 Tax=Peribacillus deserti TaxID=673318 RepID=A0A2N5MAL1_9BACI|nr:hypothetical protein [Peribacillus deserti]PLT31399.1 hypothetical protein CUU66_02745 [Peribacillus deserti]